MTLKAVAAGITHKGTVRENNEDCIAIGFWVSQETMDAAKTFESALDLPFACVVAGSPTPQSAELLGSERCRDFLGQVRTAYDAVIIDSCPLLAVVDTLELVPSADAVIVCVRASETRREQVRAAHKALAHFPPRPIGVVVTGMRRASEETTPYGYYAHAYSYAPKR